jgi:hypothetical protein
LNGQYVVSLAVSGSNVFAGAYVGGYRSLYLSTNNGQSWTQRLNGQIVYSLAVSGTNVFAGTAFNGVYLSTNNGQNWTQTGFVNQDVYSLAASGTNIFAGTYGGGVYLSTNNGQNWTQINEGLGNLNITSLLTTTDYIFAGTYGSSVWKRSELTGVNNISGSIPKSYNLYQNYPNPFNPSTKIKFDLPKSSSAKLVIYDILGREVAILVNEQLKPGNYNIEWNASNFPSGVYFYKLVAGDYVEVKKMILIK